MNQPVKTQNTTWTVQKNPVPEQPPTQQDIVERLTKLVTGERQEDKPDEV